MFLFLNRRFLRGDSNEGDGPGLRIYAIAYLIFLYAPIILLPLFAFNDATIIAFPLTGLHHQVVRRDVGRTRSCITALKNSLIVGVLDLGAGDHPGHLCRPRLDALRLSAARAGSWG